MLEIDLIDYKGEVWHLVFACCQINKLNGGWYAIWYTNEGCPEFLHSNGARYDHVPTPIFTEWFF